MNPLKVVCTSDNHGLLIDYGKFPKGDVLVIAGDISPMNDDHAVWRQEHWFKNSFAKWFREAPFKYKILIGGNHDYYLHSRSSAEINSILGEGCFYLRDEIVEIEGRSFLGIPWCSNLPRWAFNMDEDVLHEHLQKLKSAHNLTNRKIDMLVLHAGPKIGGLGKSLDLKSVIIDPETGLYAIEAPEFGNEALAQLVYDIAPQYVISGHLHSAEHSGTPINGGKTWGYCVSYLDEKYKPKYKPLLLEL